MLAFVEARLLEEWSPQQISGWLRHRQAALPSISHERIYQHVWRDKFDGGRLHGHLRHRGRRYWGGLKVCDTDGAKSDRA